MAGILASQPFASRLVGDESLSRRPMLRVITPLNAMGAGITAADGRPPLNIVGSPLHAIEWTTPVASAQVKSAILLAGLYASGTTRVHEPLATRDHTERAFPVFGLTVSSQGLSRAVAGGQQAVAPSHTLEVPGDPSSAAVWAAAAAGIPGSRIQIDDVCLNPLRLGFLRALERMGAAVEIRETGLGTGGEPSGSLIVSHGPARAATITRAEVPSLIDELPVLAASAALGGGLTVSGAAELRVKESDRIAALVAGFHALGLAAEEQPDGFISPGGQRPEGGRADACGDHRLVMAFTIVALGARGPSTISSADSVAISYPGFAADLHTLAS
jgi:3-phosphoshikimate 1-carboxyvinyltransferase